MVRLRGPGLAQTAAGPLGKTLIFSESKGRAYCKRWATPTNPKTPGQRAVRATTQLISQRWNTFSAAERATWDAPAAQTNIPPYNACLAYNLDRVRRNLCPSAFYPAASTGLGSAYSPPTLTAQGRQAAWNITVTTLSEGFAFIIYYCTDATYTHTWDRLVHFLPILGTGLHQWSYGPLAPGTHYMTLTACSRHGKGPFAFENRSVTIP